MDIISELQAELSSLNRVSHRLATTPNDGSAFQKVVALLLPRLLQRIGKNDESSKRNKNIFYNNSSMRRDSGGSNKRKEPSSPATTSAVANSGGADFAVATTDEQLQQQQQLPQQQQQQQQQIDNLHTTIHTKYIEMITHIRKRVRDDRNCLLPCDAILDLLLPAPASSTTTTTNCNNISEGEASTIVTTPTDGSSSRSSSSFGGGGGGNPFTINLSLAFLTLGINRCSPLECAQLLPRMLLFLESIYTEYDDDKISKTNKSGTISVRYMLDPNRSMRHDQMCHLILRCLESTARSNPVENAASTPRAMKQSLSSVSTTSLSRNDNTASSTESAAVKSSNSKNIHSLLHNTKQILTTNPTIASALFDLIVDVILYTPIPSTSSLIPFGLSMMGYQRLIGGAASEASSASWGCKNWREEYNTAANAVSGSGSNSGRGGGGGGGGAGSNLKQLKLKLLDMIAPCRKYALFLPEKKTMTSKTEEASTSVVVAVTEVATAARGNDEEAVSSESGSVDAIDSQQYDGMGISRTVALMVLFMGESDPDVKNRAESYLRAHMDSYRGREVPRSATMRRSATDGGAATSSIGGNDDDFPAETTIHDALLGNSVALTQSILMLCLGGAASLNIEKSLSSQYNNANSIGILKSRLGLTYYADVTIAQEQKKILSCSRMKMSEQSATSALKFAAKMLDENPRLFHVGMDMESEESDVAAVSTGTLVLAVMSDMHRPGSSASSALESAASLLNSLCVRLSLLYDARVQSRVAVPESLERIRLLLARAMKLVCSILSPTSSGESTSSSSLGTKASTTQIEIRDKCYGVICTLARSLFALNDRYALFDCGNSNPQPAKSAASFPLDMISTAKLLFGCSSNEVDMLQPRATSALDALLGAKIRAVKFIAEQKKTTIVDMNGSDAATNPWANISGHGDNKLESNVVDPSSDGLSRSLLPLLWSSARSNLPKSSRLAAARWSSELLLKLDCTNAFHILCFMSGDNDATVAAIAKQALGVDKSLGEDNAIRSGSNLSESDISDRDGNTRPAFSALLETIFGSQSSTSTRPLYSSFNVHAKAATLRFLLQSLFSEENIYDNDDDLAIQKYVSTIVGTMANYADRSLSRDEIDLIDECSIALASCSATSKEARLTVTKRGELVSELHYSYNNIAKQALTSNSSKTRRHLAEVMGHLYEDHSLWDASSTDPPLISTWIETSGLHNVSRTCKEKLNTVFGSSFVAGEVHGAAFLGSACVRAFRLAVAENKSVDACSNSSDCWDSCCGLVSLLGKGLAHADVAVGNACSKGLVIALSYDDRDAPILNERLYDSLAVAMNSMTTALKKYSSIDHADPTRSSSLIQAAGFLLAATTSGSGFSKLAKSESNSIDLGPARLQCTEALFGILGSHVHGKDDELSLMVGEALASYADAIGAGKWSSGSDNAWKEGPYDESYAFGLPPHRHVVYTTLRREILSTNHSKKNSCAAILLAFVGRASRLMNIDSCTRHRAFVQEIWSNVSLFQESFIKLLADPKSTHLSRECCCRGLAACRGLASAMNSFNVNDTIPSQIESLNISLLNAFGQSTNDGGSAMQETDSQALQRRNESEGITDINVQETQVGGAAGISEAALGAYREMASAALSLGQVDVLYSLMILSTNHSIWLVSEMRDRYSAKALLGDAEGTSEEIRVSLRPHVGKLIPKLLRACNDPSKQTREQMSNLWLALTGGGSESRALVTQHLLPTIDALIQDAGSKLWRARVGACGALADIIIGRSWQELGGGSIEVDDEGYAMKASASIRLLRLWRITVRSLDDVRTAVRERGDALGRSIRALTIRLCDPTVADLEKDIYLSNAQRKSQEAEQRKFAGYAASVSLGWLVKYGLNQPCAEATGICVSCLLGIVDVSEPTTLQPVLSELIGSLLMAMSSLEPAALNYLQVRAAGNDTNESDRYDSLERMRINMALSGPVAAALHKCLEMVRYVDLEIQKKIIPELDSSLRRGAGFSTRAATADAVNTLCSGCAQAFSFPGSSMTNPTVRLLRALYFASERERGVTAKDKMTHALGSLALLAPGKAVRALAIKACERYCESSGSNNDPFIRKAAAATIRAFAVRASRHLTDGGPNDIWCRKVLPTAFIGRYDKDAKVSSLWKDVWDEGGTAINSAGRDDVFGVLLQEKLLPFIVKATVSALRSTSWANRKAGCVALLDLVDTSILAPLNATSDEIDRLKQRANASRVLLSECVRIIARNRIWDGKGDVVDAGTKIAAKWSAGYPRITRRSKQKSDEIIWPLVLSTDHCDDLFVGDGWFELPEEKLSDDNDESGWDDTTSAAIDESDGKASEYDAALDLKEENGMVDDEEVNGTTSENDADEKLRAQPVVFSGFCRVLLNQALRATSNTATEGLLPYNAAALSGLTSLLKSVSSVSSQDTDSSDDTISHHVFIYSIVGPSLYSFIVESKTSGNSPPPILIARALESLAAAMYNGIGGDASQGGYADAIGLLKFFALLSGPTQPAWTVRQMSAVAASSVVANIPSELLRRTDTISSILECSTQTLKDKKFWKVRLSGLELLLVLVNRVGNQKMSAVDSDKRIIMEAILPYKESVAPLLFVILDSIRPPHVPFLERYQIPQQNFFTIPITKASSLFLSLTKSGAGSREAFSDITP